MRRLLLLRHAKSDWTQPGLRDHDRVLNARGRKNAPLIGAFLAHHGIAPELALVSTATRAQETWGLVREALSAPDVREVAEERLYGAPPAAILELIKNAPREIATLILVGHNPAFHAVALHLVGAGDVEARLRLQEKFPTAGLAIIEFAVDDWKDVKAGTGRLERFVSPRLLAAAID